MSIDEMIEWHREHYPVLKPIDIVKLIFQSLRGCGHLLADEQTVARRIEAECAVLSPSDAEPLTESIGRRYVRLNLRKAMHEGIPSAWIARMMLLSCEEDAPGAVTDVIDAVRCLAEQEENGSELLSAVQPLVDNNAWLPSHSAEYHAAYAPAYRVIDRRFAPLLPLLAAAHRIQKPRCLIAIDGRCASGKSTLAALLARVLDAPVVHMDDFYTPHAQKTPERLALPGGNADIERYCAEFLQPYLTNGTAAYRPYSCHLDKMMDPVVVPDSRYVVIEGSYCLHPDTGRPYDVSAFLSIPYDLQCSRILNRDGEYMLSRFRNEWIPLEEAYFSAFNLPDDQCIVLAQPDHC